MNGAENGNGNGTLRRAGDSFSRFIRDVGFPVFVSVVLLVKLVPAIEEMGRKLDRLAAVIEYRR